MINYFLLVLLPNLSCFFVTLGIFGIVTSIVLFLIYLSKKFEACDDREEAAASLYFKKTIPVFLVSVLLLFVSCFIPEKKDMLQLKAVSIISELKGVEQIPQKLIDRLNDLLGEDMKDEPNKL